MFYDQLLSHDHLGAQPGASGTNFRVFTNSEASRVAVQIWRDANRGTPWKELDLVYSQSPGESHGVTKDWTALVTDVEPGFHYTVRAWGPWNPDLGQRFNGDCSWLIDPAARAMGGESTYHDCLRTGMPGEPMERNILPNLNYAPLGVVIDPTRFDWGGDKPLAVRRNVLDREMVIAEVHVRGATIYCRILKDKEVIVNGTYFAIGSPRFIKHLKRYGVTVVELMPVHQTFLGKGGYWKYNATIFGAPEREYARNPLDPLSVVNEFKTMVKNLHDSGILLIIDFVPNHTDEGNELGETFSLKGLDNHCYRLCGPEWYAGSKRYYDNLSGCGNAINADHPGARRLILEMSRRWVLEYHIDGFRWDLFGVLSRGDSNHPLVQALRVDPVLSECIHHFENYSSVDYDGHQIVVPLDWAEWRGAYRDTTRPILLGQRGRLKHLADCLCGRRSVHLPETSGQFASVATFVTHDGFNFAQWLMHMSKCNWDDGHWPEFCHNCGFEGPTDDPKVMSARMRLWKLTWAFMSFSPLTFFRFGDHFLSYPDHNNNNPYGMGDDGNAVRWKNGNSQFASYSKRVLAIRREYANLGAMLFDRGRGDNDPNYAYGWHTIFGHRLLKKSEGWGHDHASLLLPGVIGDNRAKESRADLLVAINLLDRPLEGCLPSHCSSSGRRWTRVFDSGDETPFRKLNIKDGWYPIEAQSLALIVDTSVQS